MTCKKCGGKMEASWVRDYLGVAWVIWRCTKCKHCVIKPKIRR